MKTQNNTENASKKEGNLLRAERLKRIRHLSNLSRNEICKDNELNPHTLKGWEIGRYGGLTVKGAEKVLERIRDEGVCCTPEWLLFEIGKGPTIIGDYAKMKEMKAIAVLDTPVVFGNEEQQISEELNFFKSHYKHTLEIIVEDDGMLPFYRIGDYLAGVPLFKENIAKLIEENCIVLTEEGEIFLRKIRKGSQEGHFNLTCINTESSVTEPILYDVKLIAAAPVIFQRRKHSVL
jgi:hypothetical protein